MKNFENKMKLGNLLIPFATEKDMKDMIVNCKNKIISNKDFFNWLNGIVSLSINQNQLNLINGTPFNSKIIYIEKSNLKTLLIEGKQENIEFELMIDYSFFYLNDTQIDDFVIKFLQIYE
jgi:hypothetical protein